MTFDQWWDENQNKLRVESKATWQAALRESGTRELYESCKEASLWISQDCPSEDEIACTNQLAAAIAKYEGRVEEGASP